MFQAVFAWSEAPIGMIEGWFAAVGTFVTQQVPEGIVRSFLVDGVINGEGSVVVFLPQILVLFFFILMLEATGRSEAHTSKLQSLLRIPYAVFCLKKKNNPELHAILPT